ncbi:ROK family protein [Aciditerrimonas ferrireducens]|uniref:ROK family protein n=1 Tax=Aciditerrimonas ferrireducens TaxID=667306 RepID=A0ABV6C0L8_9ACTN
MNHRLASAAPTRADHRAVHRNNLEVVLRHLGTVGPDSRAGIATRVGLTPSTVSRLVAELLDLGLVREVADAPSSDTPRPGRPAIQLELDGRHILALGAEISVDRITVIGTDLAGTVVYHRDRVFDAARSGPEATAAAVGRLCTRAVDTVVRKSPAHVTLAGLAVAVPGLVEVETGVVTEAPNLSWRGFPFGKVLAEVSDLPPEAIVLGNDANFAALAEYRIGSRAGTPNLIYITGEVGIGGGVIAAGQGLLGSHGHGGEIGHMKLDPKGARCGCGRRGCWEALIGLDALLREAGLDDEPTPPHGRRSTRTAGAATRTAGRGPRQWSASTRAARVAERARAGDRRTLAALETLARWVGIGAANLVNIFDPQVIILGGYFRHVAEWILPAARQVMVEGVLAPDAGGCELAISSLGFEAAARGAALHMIDQVIADPARLAVQAYPKWGVPGPARQRDRARRRVSEPRAATP